MTTVNERRDVDSEEEKPKKLYSAPQLEEFGDLRELTLGSSPGITDSGNEGKVSLG